MRAQREREVFYMSSREEYKRTIVFNNQDDKDLFDAITTVEGNAQRKTPSAFIMDLVEKDFLPENPQARQLCEKIYRSCRNIIEKNKNEKNRKESYSGKNYTIFDALSELYAYIAQNADDERYNRCYVLINYTLTLFDETNSYINKKNSVDTFLYYLEEHDKVISLLSDKFPKLCAAVNEEIDSDEDKYWLGRFALLIDQKYSILRTEACTYQAMSLLCKLVDGTKNNNVKDYIVLINLIRAMSKNWD